MCHRTRKSRTERAYCRAKKPAPERSPCSLPERLTHPSCQRGVRKVAGGGDGRKVGHTRTLRFLEKWIPVFRPELREIKNLGHFHVSMKRRNDLEVLKEDTP